MEAKQIDFAKLNEAVEKFGSLQKANAQLETDKLALEKGNVHLKQENKKLAATKDKLANQVENMNTKVKNCQSQLQSLANQIKVHIRQHELFCGFMAMVAESPSVTDSIDTLIASFKKLEEPGWHLPKNADEMRSLFVQTVMGDYLKCFRCDHCGAKFIVNKEPCSMFFINHYECPACQLFGGVKADDSFLNAMVSEEQLENTLRIEEVLKENEVLLPLKAFLDVPCEICNEPITEWTEQNVKIVVDRSGWGHNKCWNSTIGQIKKIAKLVQKINGES